MRIIYVDPTLTRVAGHPFHMALGFRDELTRRRIDAVFLAHGRASAEVLAAIGARAQIGRSSYELVLDDEIAAPIEEFLDTADAFAQGMATCGIDISRDDVVLIPGALHGETLGLARWLQGLDPARRPRSVLNYISDWFINHTDGKYGVRARCYRYAARKLWGAGERERALLTTNSPGMVRHLSHLLDAPTALYPLPMWYPPPQAAAQPREPGLSVAIIGEGRTEKGSALIPEILHAALALAPSLSFRVQLATEFRGMDRKDWLARLPVSPRIRVHGGALTRDDYFREIHRTDLLLLPYRPLAYALRTSGIFAEAAALARPMVVPAATWMAEQIDAGMAAGITFASHTPASIAAALAEAASRLPQLRDEAFARADAWRAAHSIAAFLDRLVADLDR